MPALPRPRPPLLRAGRPRGRPQAQRPLHQGVSLKPLLDDPAQAWDRPAYTQVQRGKHPGYSVRTERWRYTEWDDGKEGVQLYDHDADPHEYKNVADDPKYAKVLDEMKGLVKKNWPVRVEGGKADGKNRSK